MFGRLRRTTRAAAVMAVAGSVLAVLPGAAVAADCPTLPSSQPFMSWGDTALYTLAPGGGFESSLSWTKSGSPALVSPNSPFNLSGAGKTSVRLRGKDTITSPVVCVSAIHPYMRFVARANDAKSRLVLEVLWNDKGTNKVEILEEHPADLWRAWAPSKVVPLGAKLPTGSGEVHQIRLRIRLKDSVGEWLVDDVFIDPRASR